MTTTRGAPDATALQTALKRNEIICFYQPKIDIQTGACNGVEALARWLTPEGRTIPPSQFIAHFFKTGLSEPFTLSILSTAAHDAAAHPTLNVSVNTTLEVFENPHLPERIIECLHLANLEPSRLTLEITENDGYLFGGGPQSADRIFEELADQGVKFSLDDYGTGRATLERLRAYPFHEMKHARPHLLGIADNQLVRDLIRSTNNLAHSMGIAVVAEGVETEEQLKAVEEVGCDSAQGFLIARPMPYSDLTQWCAGNPPQSR